MDNFIQTLSDEQRAALLKALTGDDFKPEVESRFQHEEPISEAVDGDFTMNRDLDKHKSRKRVVKAGKNTWEDTGEHSDVSTPKVKRTPRNRQPPKMKDITCNSCGKTFTLNSSLVYGEYYRCESCTGGK